jgi:hypothetical protein
MTIGRCNNHEIDTDLMKYLDRICLLMRPPSYLQDTRKSETALTRSTHISFCDSHLAALQRETRLLGRLYIGHITTHKCQTQRSRGR